MKSILSDNSKLKDEIQILTAQLSDSKVDNIKLREQMEGEIQAQSKLLVNGNQKAKADHFSKIKSDLLKS